MAKPHNSDNRHAPLGEPPKYFDDNRREIWDEVKENCPLALKRADTYLVEQLAILTQKMRGTGITMTGSDMSQMRHILDELDMTPKSRTPKSKTSTGGRADTSSDAGGNKFAKYGAPPRPKKTK